MRGGGGWGSRGGGVLAPSLGTHCEPDPKSGGGESRDRKALKLWSGGTSLKGHALTLWPLKQDMQSL